MPTRLPQIDFKTQLKAEMPRIPGVTDSPAAESNVHAREKVQEDLPARSSALPAFDWKFFSTRWGMLLAAAVVAAGLGLWVLHASHRQVTPSIADDAPADLAPPAEAPPAAEAIGPARLTASGTTIVASAGELEKPWSAKRFTFADPATHANVAAMIVRLPSGAANRREAYWAFSLTEPFKTCELEYVSDVAQLSTRFAFRANHPMVVSACDASVYDPLRLATVGEGAWVRGEVVSGAGVRPPTSIDLAIQGNTIVADRME